MKVYAIVLAAGKGTRMKSDKPKVVHEVLYKPMINHVVDELKKIGADETIVVVGHEAEQVKALLDDSVTAVYQKEQLGTGHAVLMAKEALGDKEGMTLILCGDAPLIRAETLQGMIEAHEKNHNMGTVMTADCDTSTHYGRIVKEDGQVTGIVEFKDLQPDQMDITEMNTGEYCFDNKALFEALEEVSNENAQNEYYLTDVIGIMNNKGLKVDTYKIDDFNEVGGVNDRVALEDATKMLQKRINHDWLVEGVSIIDASTTYIGRDVEIGADAVIEPGCIITGHSRIGLHAHIGAYSILHDVVVEDSEQIGAYTKR
jgi:bifunctional UDP-N-acetylglucosamine pyrophosphorylase/glucosamine-1-phosphate N-acetyltransferase